MRSIIRVAIVSLAALAAVVQGADRFVAPGASGGGASWADPMNIQNAVVGASAGSTVWVTNGTYLLTGELIVTNFTIRSFNNGAMDRDGTIINANYPNVSNRCFTLSHSNALVEGVTITNGYVASGNGGGVSMSAGTLRNCLVTGNRTTNSAGAGGGAYASGAQCLITNCDVIGNSSGGSGGGVYVTTSAQLVNSRVRGNRGVTSGSSVGGGVCMASSAFMLNCEITGNSLLGAVGNNGCGVCIQSGNTIRNCLIVGNTGGYYGGGVSAPASGGGVVESCTIIGNVAYLGQGIGATGSGTVQIRNTICRDNRTTGASSDVSGYGNTTTFFITNCCLPTMNFVQPSTNMTGTIATPPSFVNAAAGNYRLRPWSAGVDVGTNQSWMSTATDLDGLARIGANNLVDMGAYETSAEPVAIQYVARGGQTPVSPYTNGWQSAASNIEDAVNAGYEGTTILITNGVYTLTDQIVTGNRTFRSYHSGAMDVANTVVDGGNFPGRPLTNRCFTLNSDIALVEGLTISNGYAAAGTNGGGVYIFAGTLNACLVTGNTSSNAGGGVYATGASSVITNCDVSANTAWGAGGGVYLTASAQLVGSRIKKNQGRSTTASHGGGVFVGTSAILNNSEIVSNTTASGSYNPVGSGIAINGGAPVRNCLIVGNTGGEGGGVGAQSSAALENCTIAGNTGSHGNGIGVNLNGSKVRLVNLVCRDTITCAYSWGYYYVTNCCLVTTNILDGNSLQCSSGTNNISTPPSFVNAAGGNYRLQTWSAGVDMGTNQAWMSTAMDLDGQPRIGPNNMVDMGAYETTAGMPADQYVAHAGQTPVWPYTNWVTAASNIQDAIDVGYEGVTYFISNGVYVVSNQITVGGSTLKSFKDGVLDRDGTIVKGGYPGSSNRCFYLNSSAAMVEGFTISNGYVAVGDGGGVYIAAGTLRNCLVTGNTQTNTANAGGGVCATGASSLITNCDIVGNTAYGSGGGVYVTMSAQLLDSRISRNRGVTAGTSKGGGVFLASSAWLRNCAIISNTVAGGVGGDGCGVVISGGQPIRNCLVVGNTGGNYGGGICTLTTGGTIENCTVVGNSGYVGGGIGGSGSATVQIRNTICRGNATSNGGEVGGYGDTTIFFITNCCLGTTNLLVYSPSGKATGAGNIGVPPSFMNAAGGNYRLWPWSAGVDAGTNQAWMSTANDLGGQTRISANNLVDMGAYETTAAPIANQFVAQGGQTPVPPYTNWAAAANNLEDAVNMGMDGATIFISNGVYTLSSQVAVGNCTIRSYKNGATDRDGTIVNGGFPNTSNRCFFMNSVLSVVEGLTISNGYVVGDGGGVYITNGTLRDCVVTGCIATNGNGGGVLASEVGSVITNCQIVGNVAYGNGGGVYLDRSAQLVASRVERNQIKKTSSYGAGVCMGNATVAYLCEIVSNVQNTADGNTQNGGGVWVSYNTAILRNCLIAGNSGGLGGGVGLASAGQGGTVESCTIVGNTGGHGAGIGLSGLGGVSTVTIKNTICRDEARAWYGPPGNPGVNFYLNNSCLLTTNLVGATNVYVTAVTTNDPIFANSAGGNYRVKGHSPCVNTGTNLLWMIGAVDLDGSARISPLIGGTVDMGAYEFPVAQGSVFTLR